MKIIGENLHIISPSVREALVLRNEDFIVDLIKKQSCADYIDLNIGPAKGNLENIFPWLVNLVSANSDLKISFDTTNADEMKRGFSAVKNPSECIINSTSDDTERLEKMTDIACEYNANLIALTLSSKDGIPKTADGRLELAIDIYETCMMKEISNDRIYFDPLILPLKVDQAQAMESLNTIKVIKESFDPVCNTVIGLSNISNGAPKEMRPLINKVYLALAMGAGLDTAIVDATDSDLIGMVSMLENQSAESDSDKLLLDIMAVTRDFVDLDEITYDKNDKKSVDIYKTARIIVNKDIYTHSFTQV